MEGNAGDNAFLIVSAALVMFMTVLYAGLQKGCGRPI